MSRIYVTFTCDDHDFIRHWFTSAKNQRLFRKTSREAGLEEEIQLETSYWLGDITKASFIKFLNNHCDIDNG